MTDQAPTSTPEPELGSACSPDHSPADHWCTPTACKYSVSRIPGAGGWPRANSKPGPYAVVQVVTDEAKAALTAQGYIVDLTHVCIFTGSEEDCSRRVEMARMTIAGSEIDRQVQGGGVSFIVVPTSELEVK